MAGGACKFSKKAPRGRCVTLQECQAHGRQRRRPASRRSTSGSCATRWRSSRPASPSSARARGPALRRLHRQFVQLGRRSPRRSSSGAFAAARRASRRSKAAERYAVNVLSAAQVELARRFSRPHADRFASVPFRLGWSDAPLIDGCVAWFECRHHARHRAGDHVVFIGEVVHRRAGAGQGSRVPARALSE